MDYLRDTLRELYGSQVSCYSGRGGEIYQNREWCLVPKEEIKLKWERALRKRKSIMTAEEQYITKADLKLTRGWTDAAIKKFLGKEDKNARNPIYRSASPVCLYLFERVLAAEASAEFEIWRQASQKRKEAAKKASETRKRREEEERAQEQARRELIQHQYSQFNAALNAVTLPFTPLPHKELVALACNSWLAENPNIEPSNAQLEVQSIPFEQLIEPFGTKSRDEILRLTERVCDALNSNDTIQYHKLCKECESVIVSCKNRGSKEAYKMLKKAFNIHHINKAASTRDPEVMSHQLHVFVETVADGTQVPIIKGSQGCVNLLGQIKAQVLLIHNAELRELGNELQAIASREEYKELATEYDIQKWIQRKYQEMLIIAYPKYFNHSDFLA
jgi:hypothetical protein